MTTTDTYDVEGTIKQIHALEEAGCELVRVTVPKPEDAGALSRDHASRSASRSSATSTSTTRWRSPRSTTRWTRSASTPATSATDERFRQVVRKAKDKGIPMRIGVNAGSLERDLCEKYEFPCPPAMVESALRYIEIGRERRLSRHHRVAEVVGRAGGRGSVPVVRADCATTPRTSASPKPASRPTRSRRAPRASRRSCSTGSATRSASRCSATRYRRSRPRSTSCKPRSAASAGRN